MLVLLFIVASGCQKSQDAETTRTNLPNSFFAMNFWQLDPKISSSVDAQVGLLKELGYDGALYLGALDGMEESFRALDAHGLKMFAAAVIPYDIFVDPDESCPASLKEAIKKLEGRETLLLIQFQSKVHPKSSPAGDARAVELGRELADFAHGYGVRLAIYPHANIWCERVDHAVRIAKQCGRENLGVTFNLTHWLWTDPHGNLESLVRDAMPHLFLVTINGISHTAPQGTLETLDRGDYDVGGFLKPFIAAGYRGPIGLQCVSIKGDARDNLTRSMAAWREISAQLAGAVNNPQR
ncbi:MAG TPA: TIM barrel protein [Phycisphaerae bacterium]|nr:TIM barrel protein [Phycisphaerae bacterium]